MKILFLYYTQYRNRSLTVNINLMWSGGAADLEAISLFMKTEVIEQRNTLEYMVKRIFFIYFSNKTPIA
jgi:hypothetical protein